MTDPAFAEAERLVREARRAAEAAAAAASAPPPPRGWEVPADGRPAADPFPDLARLVALLDGLRGTVPPELAARLTEALRELLVALRAVLDYSIARLEPPPPAPPPVEDIPVE